MRPQTSIALLIRILLLLPNVYWNAADDFLTLKHTGDNITGSGFRFPGPPVRLASSEASSRSRVRWVFAVFLLDPRPAVWATVNKLCWPLPFHRSSW